MKAITLDKLRTLAAAVADAEQGSKAWDAATDALSDKFSPQCLVNLIDQLEAAQRERDEAIKHKNESGDRFYKAVQYGAKLEAELKRRDDAVPVAVLDVQSGRTDGNKLACVFTHAGHALPDDVYSLYAAAPAAVLNQPDDSTAVYQMIDDGNWYDTTKSQYEDALERGELCRIVYPAPPAAVLPPALDERSVYDNPEICFWKHDVPAFVRGANWMREQAIALGCQSPATTLPPDNVTYFAFSPDYGFDFFKNKQDAINTAQGEIDGYREDRDDGWDVVMRMITRKKPAFAELHQTGVLTRIVAVKNADGGGWRLFGVWRDKNIAVFVEAARGGIREWSGLDYLAGFCESCGISLWEIHNQVAQRLPE